MLCLDLSVSDCKASQGDIMDSSTIRFHQQNFTLKLMHGHHAGIPCSTGLNCADTQKLTQNPADTHKLTQNPASGIAVGKAAAWLPTVSAVMCRSVG
jgi:hypothetical protein